ncbi:MAG: hypothetical protein HKN76_22770 [Saprospiraceae bacterium]|nr:hypothetical protein [Saprospiraceae bacterium]
MKVLCYMGFAILVLDGCSGRTTIEEAMQMVLSEEKKIQCELMTLKAEITHEWDVINLKLEQNLPVHMPEEEKSNLLKVRNAGLIRMFESFRDFDQKIKESLQAVENKDQKISLRITELKKDLQQVEAKKMLLFNEINDRQGDAVLARHKASYSEALQKPCY